MSDKIFINGLIFKRPSLKAPDWVKGTLSIKVNELIEFLKINNKNGWVNIDLKESKDGKYYAELNTYQRQEYAATEIEKEKEVSLEEANDMVEDEDEINISDIPF